MPSVEFPPRGTAAVLTPPGRGAVAVVGIRGRADLWTTEPSIPFVAASSGATAATWPRGRVAFGWWGRPASEREEVVVVRTAEEVWEVQCHGGAAAVRRILDDLALLGIDVVPSGWTWCARTGVGLRDLEWRQALAEAPTLRTAELLLDQRGEHVSAAIEALWGTAWIPAARHSAAETVRRWLGWRNLGLHLTQPWRVILRGRPNVGKSSLINALLGYARSVVHDQPGTTRDVVTALTALDGWPIEFADTAGIRATADPLEAAGIARAAAHGQTADLRVLVLDRSVPPTPADHHLLQAETEALLVANKADLPDAWGSALPDRACLVSAATSAGIPELGRQMVARLVPQTPGPGDVVPWTPRQAELWCETLAALEAGDRARFEAARRLWDA